MMLKCLGVKFDSLGLKNLDIINDCLNLINKKLKILMLMIILFMNFWIDQMISMVFSSRRIFRKICNENSKMQKY